MSRLPLGRGHPRGHRGSERLPTGWKLSKKELSPIFYKIEAKEASEPVSNVKLFRKPIKIVPSAVNGEAGSFGTTAWAAGALSKEGFVVKEEDQLQVNLQETQKGFSPKFFTILRRAPRAARCWYCMPRKGRVLLLNYYKETGTAAEPGFYPILSPEEAFARAMEQRVYALSQNLEFSFQEVFLTYHNFVVERNGSRENVKLPSYCFVGMETFPGRGELKIYLPAVK